MAMNRTQPDRDALLSYMPTDHLQAIAWVNGLHWALGQEEMRDAFQVTTGMKWKRARSGLDRLIGEATGHDRAFIEAFAKWFNENIWGRP